MVNDLPGLRPDLTDRRVLVTGGVHGIGRTYVEAFVALGARVAVIDLELPDDDRHPDGSASYRTVDLAQPDETQAVIDDVVGELGGFDVVVNNAGMFARVPMSRTGIVDTSVEEYQKMMDVNLRGTWMVSRATRPHFADTGGSIINVASSTALKGSNTRSHYVASKAGIIGLTKALAREFGPAGIRVNCLAPGSTTTEQDAEEAASRREVAARARALGTEQVPAHLVGPVLFLASDMSAFMTGQTLVVDGGDYLH